MRLAIGVIAAATLVGCASTPEFKHETFRANKQGLVSAVTTTLSAERSADLIAVTHRSDLGEPVPIWIRSDPSRFSIEGDTVCNAYRPGSKACHPRELFLRIYVETDNSKQIDPFNDETLSAAQRLSEQGDSTFSVQRKVGGGVRNVYRVSEIAEVTETRFCGRLIEGWAEEEKCLPFDDLEHFSVRVDEEPDSILEKGAKSTLNIAATAGLIALFGTAAIVNGGSK